MTEYGLNHDVTKGQVCSEPLRDFRVKLEVEQKKSTLLILGTGI